MDKEVKLKLINDVINLNEQNEIHFNYGSEISNKILSVTITFNYAPPHNEESQTK
jgi:hypothetical protein